jgi:uncharacterized protein YrzB (UPF0473 family)
MRKIRIPNYFFVNSEVRSDGATLLGDAWKRSYQIWQHAKDLIDSKNNNFYYADAVANLKRSLNHRLKLIEELYCFKNIEIPNKPNGYLELLERYGIVRPYLIKLLLNIRNDIEHNDADPPALQRCQELIDIIWYLLKSTDVLVQLQNNGAYFTLCDKNGNETYYESVISVDFSHEARMEIKGWFPHEMIYDSTQIDFCEVLVKEIHSKEEKWINSEYHSKKLNTDIWVVGELIPAQDMRLDLIKRLLTPHSYI